jgi:hypothetical protein
VLAEDMRAEGWEEIRLYFVMETEFTWFLINLLLVFLPNNMPVMSLEKTLLSLDRCHNF